MQMSLVVIIQICDMIELIILNISACIRVLKRGKTENYPNKQCIKVDLAK